MCTSYWWISNSEVPFTEKEIKRFIQKLKTRITYLVISIFYDDDDGFLAWHQHFVAKLEHWLVLDGGEKFVPLPFWNPAKPIPAQLDNNNKAVNHPLPSNLQPKALKKINKYSILNNRIIPYHNDVHDNMGANMPNPDTSSTDPIFWPFHSFLLAVYEQWRNHKTKK